MRASSIKASKNIDEAEIAKFSKLANEWWDPFGHFKPLHDINPLRFEFINKHCVISNQRILDVGCGGGILAESLYKAGGEVTGIDLSEETITVASCHANEAELAIDYQVSSVEDYAANFSGQFDIVTCMELLEHVPDPALMIASCAKLLKPEGHLLVSTLNRNLKSYLFAILGAEYVLKLLPTGTHHYEKFIRPTELFDMSLQAGLRLVHMEGISYSPFTKTYQLTADISVNYLAHYQKD